MLLILADFYKSSFQPYMKGVCSMVSRQKKTSETGSDTSFSEINNNDEEFLLPSYDTKKVTDLTRVINNDYCS